MTEYIERGTAIAKLTALEVIKPNATMIDAKRLLADMSTANVAPIKHGRWIKVEDYYGLSIIKCSECREEWCFEVEDDITDLKYNYCPNCGAKMDEEEG